MMFALILLLTLSISSALAQETVYQYIFPSDKHFESFVSRSYDQLDSTRAGVVTKDRFAALFSNATTALLGETEGSVNFEELDKDGDGLLTRNEFSSFFKTKFSTPVKEVSKMDVGDQEALNEFSRKSFFTVQKATCGTKEEDSKDYEEFTKCVNDHNSACAPFNQQCRKSLSLRSIQEDQQRYQVSVALSATGLGVSIIFLAFFIFGGAYLVLPSLLALVWTWVSVGILFFVIAILIAYLISGSIKLANANRRLSFE
ncbi:hypothetical protein MP638_004330 [Amoeboaphelidium occidentale]|nr:hypothetical protein MP638_004330 [Amoeboaphelidium occidentale]